MDVKLMKFYNTYKFHSMNLNLYIIEIKNNETSS